MVSILSIKPKTFCKFQKFFFRNSSIICGVLQRSILSPLLFFIYVNHMLMAVKCNLFLYPSDTCLVFQSDNVKDIEKQLNLYFPNICN